ncbi:MAG: serine hydrolase [Pseudomonadota bacterium]
MTSASTCTWTGAPATLGNWRTAPHNRWAFHHVREIVPSAEIRNDPGHVHPLAQGEQIEMPAVDTREGALAYDDLMEKIDIDALVVAQQGKILHERYRNGMGAGDPHILMSVSKSMLGLLYGVLSDRGLVDINAPASDYIPALQGTAFQGATIRHLLDMRTGVTFDEDYELTEGLIVDYRKSTNWNPLAAGDPVIDLHDFLLTLRETHTGHGGPFNYVSPCTDLLGWIVERVTGLPYAQAFSQHLWQPLGAERPAYITVDRVGAPRAAGGVCMTARDLTRIGLMIADGGNGVVPQSWLHDIATAGDPKAWDTGGFAKDYPGWSMHYRSKWYVIRDKGPILMCVGIHGQNLFICLNTGLVMAKFASFPTALDTSGERLGLRLFQAIRDTR